MDCYHIDGHHSHLASCASVFAVCIPFVLEMTWYTSWAVHGDALAGTLAEPSWVLVKDCRTHSAAGRRELDWASTLAFAD